MSKWLKIAGLSLLLVSCTGVSAQTAQVRFLPAEQEMRKSFSYPPTVSVYEVKSIARVNLDSAIRVLQDLIILSRGHADYLIQFESYFALGACYLHNNDYERSANAYRNALIYSLKTENPLSNFCRTLNGTGNIFLVQGDYREAAQYYFRAAQIAEKEAGKDSIIADQLVRIYNNMSSALIELGEYNKAFYYLDKAEMLANALQHSIRLPSIWNNKAAIYNKTGDTHKAWQYNQKALSLAKVLGHYHAEYTALQGLAIILLDRHQPLKAIPYLEEALQVKGNANASYPGKTFYLLGYAYLASRDYRRAEAYFISSLRNAFESRSPNLALLIHEQLASLYAGTHEYQKALAHLQTAYRLNDSLHSKEKTAAVHLLEIKYRTAQKDKEITQKQLQLNEQQRLLQGKNIWIGSIAAGALILAILLFVIYRHYRHRNRLQLKQQEIDNLKAVIRGEEKERARIARELHDGIAGMITAVKMNFTSVRNEHPSLTRNAQFHDAMQLLEETAHEIRHTAHNLTPEVLVQHELPDAISLFCRQVQRSSGLEISVLAYGSFEELHDEFKLSLYRMIQELISNIIKHAQAGHVIVQLSHHGNVVGLTVEDDGIGLHAAKQESGIGMQNLQTRIKSLNGKLTVESFPDRGTTVYIEFNLSEPARASYTPNP